MFSFEQIVSLNTFYWNTKYDVEKSYKQQIMQKYKSIS